MKKKKRQKERTTKALDLRKSKTSKLDQLHQEGNSLELRLAHEKEKRAEIERDLKGARRELGRGVGSLEAVEGLEQKLKRQETMLASINETFEEKKEEIAEEQFLDNERRKARETERRIRENKLTRERASHRAAEIKRYVRLAAEELGRFNDDCLELKTQLDHHFAETLIDEINPGAAYDHIQDELVSRKGYRPNPNPLKRLLVQIEGLALPAKTKETAPEAQTPPSAQEDDPEYAEDEKADLDQLEDEYQAALGELEDFQGSGVSNPEREKALKQLVQTAQEQFETAMQASVLN